jgi:formylglycine-generating enzyme
MKVLVPNQSTHNALFMKTALIPMVRCSRRLTLLLAAGLGLSSPFAPQAGAKPVVRTVVAFQRAGTKLVDIPYSIYDPDATSVNVFILVSSDNGQHWDIPASTFPAGVRNDVGPGVPVSTRSDPGESKWITWDAGTDWDGHLNSQCKVRVLANDAGLVLIPAGTFTMGDANDGNAGGTGDMPTHTVTITKPYYMDQKEVTGGLWNLVKVYADPHGYSFENPGASKASSHPVQSVNWLDAIKWCNARSEMEGGLTPVYYTAAPFITANVLRSGAAATTIPLVNPDANGYRLPTEAEWERAARGGLSANRFPWGNNIAGPIEFNGVFDVGDANYYGCPQCFNYDLGPGGYNLVFWKGDAPFTGAVDRSYQFGYYLQAMAGNVAEWCWDWYSATYYNSSPPTDPPGPDTGTARVLRGGGWSRFADELRCADRSQFSQFILSDFIGFRCVRGVP